MKERDDALRRLERETRRRADGESRAARRLTSCHQQLRDERGAVRKLEEDVLVLQARVARAGAALGAPRRRRHADAGGWLRMVMSVRRRQ